jgi:alkylhydroperoxidase/carboxymuconolactone decarboxylase family protein YurZ
VRLSERLRAHAFESAVLDRRTTHLLLFGMLLALGVDGAPRYHAAVARREGASWPELLKVAELASAVLSLGPLNRAAATLSDLERTERNPSIVPTDVP